MNICIFFKPFISPTFLVLGKYFSKIALMYYDYFIFTYVCLF